jgi:hypothetical protein
VPLSQNRLASEQPARLSNDSSLLESLIWWIVGFLAVVVVLALKRSRKTARAACSLEPSERTPTGHAAKLSLTEAEELGNELERLARRAWKSADTLHHRAFWLSVEDLSNRGNYSEIVRRMLEHAMEVTPGLEVPRMVPRVITTPQFEAAGQFHEEDGWVTLKVGPNFIWDRAAAVAILAHETCHYILENSGIRESDYLRTERLTDICMFVCGFGGVFLDGYKRETAQSEYRKGHRLGYLSDDTYAFLKEEADRLRRGNAICLPDRVAEVRMKIRQLIPNAGVRERLIKGTQKKYPEMPEVEVLETVLIQYERDRR